MKVISSWVPIFRGGLGRGQIDFIHLKFAGAADHGEIQSPDLRLRESIIGRAVGLPIRAAGEA